MANRSYLYATDIIPGSPGAFGKPQLTGIAEWNYDIPMVFKVLMSGQPRTCSSAIWSCPEDLAIAADYAAGVARLRDFLAQVKAAEARPLIDEALSFLDKPECKKKYFFLECGEIFDISDDEGNLPEKNTRLFEEISNLGPSIEQALATIPGQSARPGHERRGILHTLFGKPAAPAPSPEDTMGAIKELGLGNWSNYLYHDFSHNHGE